MDVTPISMRLPFIFPSDISFHSMVTDKLVIEQIISLKKQGKSIPEIIILTGATRSTVYRYCRLFGLTSPYVKYTQEEINVIISGKKAGMTTEEIAKKLGRSCMSVIHKTTELRKADIIDSNLSKNNTISKKSKMRKNTNFRRWSVDDVAKLKMLGNSNTPWDKIANELGRTVYACKVKFQKVMNDGVIPVYATNKTVTIKGDDMRKSLESYSFEEIFKYLWDSGIRIVDNKFVMYKKVEFDFNFAS